LPASNRTFGPVQISKINGDEGAECGLDISQKEIHPIEPVPALPRGGAAPDYADAMFNLALCYSEVVGTRKRRSTGQYLANDALSEWAARARRSLKFCEMQIHLSAS
jgi:hypothetical protein